MDNANAATLEPRICPFLRATHDGQLADPVLWPDQANACTALGEAAPQSLRQQEYACLVSAHLNCPRFVRGVISGRDAARAGRRLASDGPCRVAALLVLPYHLPCPSGSLSPTVGWSSRACLAEARRPVSRRPTEPRAVPASRPTLAPSSTNAAPTAATEVAASVDAATRQPNRLTHAHAGSDRDATTELRSVRPARTVRRRTGLLDLHGPRRRQPCQHRALLRVPLAVVADGTHGPRQRRWWRARNCVCRHRPADNGQRHRGSTRAQWSNLLHELSARSAWDHRQAIDEGPRSRSMPSVMFGVQREEVRGVGHDEPRPWRAT